MAELDAGYAKRRDALFARARGLIRSDPEAFTEAGRKLAELFPTERRIELPDPDYPDGVRRDSLFTRIDLARQAASDPDCWASECGDWFDFDANAPDDDRRLYARLTVLAILLAADPKANEAIPPKVCELSALPWDTSSDRELGRGWVNWRERDWPHGNDAPPKVLDRLERAAGHLAPSTANPEPALARAVAGYDRTKPGRNPVDEARRATADLCRLAEIFARVAEDRARAEDLVRDERDKKISELRAYIREVYGEWNPAIVRARRAIQAIRPLAAGWGIELGPAERMIDRLKGTFDEPLVLGQGEQPGDHLFRSAASLGFRRGVGSNLNFSALSEAVAVVATLSNALRGVDEAGLESGEAREPTGPEPGYANASKPLTAAQRAFLGALGKASSAKAGSDLAATAGFSDFRRPLALLIKYGWAEKPSARGGYVITGEGRVALEAMRP